MNVLIIGGGISGISAAKVALKANHTVTVLESSAEPGGLMARIANCRVGFKTFFDEIRDDPHLTVLREGKIASVRKKDDLFIVILEDGRTITADRVIIAAGLLPYDPVAYKGKRIMTSLEYDALIDQRQGELPGDFQKIGFFLCVGSRSQENPLCSAVCCSYTIREIKWTLQRAKPEMTVFYNDLRLFGQEYYLEQAYRDAGVKFIRANSRYFDADESGVTVRYYAGEQIQEERFNYVVLAIGLRPNPELAALSKQFGFSLNEYGFVNEQAPLQTGVAGVYVSGGALEPMNIKDAILTGFGAGLIAVKGPEILTKTAGQDERLYREEEPDFALADGDPPVYLFYLGTDNVGYGMFAEFISAKFTEAARKLRQSGKTVYIVTKNMVTPSYGELAYESARREGVVFVHLEEDERVSFAGNRVCIAREGKELIIDAGAVIRFDAYAELLKDREFLSRYRSEPQLRWSPTKWGRKKYHVGFIRHPRAQRWERREILGALGEMMLDNEVDRVLPQVNEERCSGCGSCKDACPASAIEMEIQERQVALFGPITSSGVPIAHVKEDTCIGCGLCASSCPADVISFP